MWSRDRSPVMEMKSTFMIEGIAVNKNTADCCIFGCKKGDIILVDFDGVSFISNFSIFRRQNGSKMDQDFTLCTLVSVRDYGHPVHTA